MIASLLVGVVPSVMATKGEVPPPLTRQSTLVFEALAKKLHRLESVGGDYKIRKGLWEVDIEYSDGSLVSNSTHPSHKNKGNKEEGREPGIILLLTLHHSRDKYTRLTLFLIIQGESRIKLQ